MTEAKEKHPGAHTAIEFTRQIWLAGLGAYVRATEAKNREALDKRRTDIEQHVRSSWDDWIGKATESWSDWSQTLEDQFSRTLGSVGVATRDDVQRLAEQVEALNRTVQELKDSRDEGNS
ncbi:phasin family protein [Saccharospirillum salsuginis]|uniref:Poly(Hydroxyalkanoate) granule-associated protein n=1 Tax=Saccharospirillum salsuginis TaxID=418750 RepID=A0A918K6N6_9GAMM|nr:phasin family protein [Saccharospirillum salsuginis]GGX52406.1 hypothetical protein GCM10007392_19680 [Saccharospirillum salsuginis]